MTMAQKVIGNEYGNDYYLELKIDDDGKFFVVVEIDQNESMPFKAFSMLIMQLSDALENFEAIIEDGPPYEEQK
jgi:hypothetical protein